LRSAFFMVAITLLILACFFFLLLRVPCIASGNQSTLVAAMALRASLAHETATQVLMLLYCCRRPPVTPAFLLPYPVLPTVLYALNMSSLVGALGLLVPSSSLPSLPSSSSSSSP
jgi:hypothetical protein